MGTIWQVNDFTDQQLLRDYAEHESEPAFAEIVRRHVDLVYSAARRMVCDAHATQDVTQGVFVLLAQHARQLSDRPTLAGWLHCTARNLAVKAVRSDVRRRAREQEVACMNESLSSDFDTSWEHIAPHLDDALGELSEPDREALLLRYFKNHNLRTVGTTLGISDDAAQKRVSRAVERLREFFTKRGVTVGASGLVVAISANAVQPAPVGLGAAISTAAALAGTTVASTATTAKAIAMTTLQKALVTATVTVLAGAGIYEARQASQLRGQVQTLQQQQSPLAEQIQQLQRERADATNRLILLAEEMAKGKNNKNELLKLRGEVTVLRQQIAKFITTTPQPVAQTAPVNQPTDSVEETKRIGREKSLDGRNYATQLVMFAADNQGWFPTNWQHVVKYEKDFPGSGTNDFQLVHPQPINRNDLGTNAARTALVREYLAWPTPDGQWGKIYGFADGHSEFIILKDDNFTEWEQENTFNPIPNSK